MTVPTDDAAMTLQIFRSASVAYWFTAAGFVMGQNTARLGPAPRGSLFEWFLGHERLPRSRDACRWKPRREVGRRRRVGHRLGFLGLEIAEVSRCFGPRLERRRRLSEPEREHVVEE